MLVSLETKDDYLRGRGNKMVNNMQLHVRTSLRFS